MDIRTRIQAAERRAKRIGLSVEQLCTRADVHRATWQRWKAETVGPSLIKWEQVEAALAEAEAEAATAAPDKVAS